VLPEVRFWLPGSYLVVVSSHAAAITVAVVVGTWWAGRRAGPAMRLVALAAAACGLVGARAAFVALHGWPPADPWWSGGLASMGGVVAGLCATWLAARSLGVDARRAFDAVVPAGLLALGIGRVGCFLGGCCYGAATTLPWGVVFPAAGSAPRHPLQLYSAAVDLVLVATVGRSHGPPGRRALRTLAAFAAARIALETLRDPATTDQLGAATLPQAVCATLLLAAGLAALRERRRRESD
jgi:phosphatidylglycerol:prolipoprotein diacylglycerol transferase